MSREKCGCRSNDSRWLEMCDEHKTEFLARHQRAQAEKDMAELLGRYSTDEEPTTNANP